MKSNYYTKTVEFFDINYTLESEEMRKWIFGDYCHLLNSFDESVTLQLSLLLHKVDLNNVRDMAKAIRLRPSNDGFNHVRKEFYNMLKGKLIENNQGIIRRKFITFGVNAKGYKTAYTKIKRIERELIANFNVFGASAYPLDGYERLKLLHKFMNISPKTSFSPSKINDIDLKHSKDYIAPISFDFTDKSQLSTGYYKKPTDKAEAEKGKIFSSIYHLSIDAPELPDNILLEFLEKSYPMIFTMQIQAIESSKGIKWVKNKLSDIDKMKVDENKKAMAEDYSMEIMPPDIELFSKSAHHMLEVLRSTNNKLFDVNFLITNFGKNQEELDGHIATTKSIAQKYGCDIKKLDYLQEQSFISSLPLGFNKMPKQIRRKLPTSSLAAFLPFNTSELFQKDNESVYYGINAVSGNIIFGNRKNLTNPNGLILGIPGSGKSFAVKREMINVFLATNDDILISDPEAEYSPLVKALKGVVIKISASPTKFINPMDIVLDYGTEEEPIDPIALKSEFVLSLFETITTRTNGLGDTEKAIIDRCVPRVYNEYLSNPIPENMPILSDLEKAIREDAENEQSAGVAEEARKLATALSLYTTGQLHMFNHHTNIDINNRIVCFDTKALGENLRPLAMLIMQDQIWGKVSQNRAVKKGTWAYFDEFHLLIRSKQTAQYSSAMYKRFRKWGAIPTAITQNVQEFLQSKEVATILANCQFIVMLNQGAEDGKILQKELKFSDGMLKHITNAPPGDALIFYGDTIIPSVDKFPKDTELYRLMTTKISEVA